MTTQFNFHTGDTVALSIKGAKGFCYPNFNDPIRLIEDCCGLPMTWISHKGFSAVSVPASAISESNFTPENDQPYVVVWASKKLLVERRHG